MVLIGDGSKNKNINYHKDHKDLISCIITFGEVTEGGSTDYYDNNGVLVCGMKFKHGRIQIGQYDEVNHMCPQWKGVRTTINFNIKKSVLEHFKSFGTYYFDQWVRAGYQARYFCGY